MHLIYPQPSAIDDSGLESLYAYPESPPGGHWVRANMVISLDGVAAVDGRSGGLSGAADRHIFALLRSLTDVILVGAGTVRAERYEPVRPAELARIHRSGMPATPPIAVITSAIDLDLTSPLFTSAPAHARTMIMTTQAAPATRRTEAAATADVIVAGSGSVDMSIVVAELAKRGFRRILAEGGPHVLGQLSRAGLLDEFCLTVSPQCAGTDAGRPDAHGPPQAPPAAAIAGAQLRLAHVIEDSGFLLCRYLT